MNWTEGKSVTNPFTEGRILPPLLKFTMPVFLALLLQAMYGAIDLLIVGQFGTASSVSAVATGSTMMHTITCVIAGLTMGATVLIGRRIGEQEYEKAGKVVGASIVLFAIVTAVLTVAMIVFAVPFARLMQAPEEAFDQTVEYVLICSAGTVFIVAYNVISGIFRGLGNSRLPLLFVAIACVVNIVGDLLLVAVFHMDVAGAAYATVAAQAVSVVLSLIIIRRQPLPFTFTRKSIGFHKEEIRTILKLGIPIAAQDFLTNFSFLAVNSVVNGLGLVVSAGYGIANKVISFILLMPSSYMGSMSAFVAQNVGAGKPQRARKAMLYGMGTAAAIGLAMFALSFFFGDLLSMVFSSEEEVIRSSAEYLKGFSFDCILTAFLFCFMGYFNGYGKTLFVMVQGLCGAFLGRIPVALLMSQLEPVSLFRIGLATPAASLLSIILCVFYYRFSKWNRLMLSRPDAEE